MNMFLTRYTHTVSHCRHHYNKLSGTYPTKTLVILETIFLYCAKNQDVVFVALNNGRIRAHLPASSEGVLPLRFFALLSAPLNSRYNTHVIEPNAYAKCKAVLPSRSEDRISAPWSRSIVTASHRLNAADSRSGVRQLTSKTSTNTCDCKMEVRSTYWERSYTIYSREHVLSTAQCKDIIQMISLTCISKAKTSLCCRTHLLSVSNPLDTAWEVRPSAMHAEELSLGVAGCFSFKQPVGLLAWFQGPFRGFLSDACWVV